MCSALSPVPVTCPGPGLRSQQANSSLQHSQMEPSTDRSKESPPAGGVDPWEVFDHPDTQSHRVSHSQPLHQSEWEGENEEQEFPVTFSDNFVIDPWTEFNLPDLASDSDSEEEEEEEEEVNKIRVEIKPLEVGEGGSGSVSVEELERAVSRIDLTRPDLEVRLNVVSKIIEMQLSYQN